MMDTTVKSITELFVICPQRDMVDSLLKTIKE